MKTLTITLLLLLIHFNTFTQSLLKDINTANASSNPYNATVFDSKIIFQANNELWSSDGTISGTTILQTNSSIGPSFGQNYSSNNRLVLNGNILFVAQGSNSNGSYVGAELWRTNGTTQNSAALLADIYSGTNSSSPVLLTVVGSKAFFTAYDPINGNELWVTDGNNVTLLGDLNSGSGGVYLYQNNYSILGDKLIFSISTNNLGQELWVSDGTPAGTYLLKDINPGTNSSGVNNLITVGSKVFFLANDGINGYQVWVTDGTTVETKMVTNLNTDCLYCYTPSRLTNFNGLLIFKTHNPLYGHEIYKSDGTVAGTTILKDIRQGSQDSNPDDLTVVGNKLFFTADDGTVGRELWVTDGTTSGTRLVKDINISNTEGDITFPTNYSQRKFINVDGTLFFIANSGTEGYELWKSDGTAAGTVLVKDFLPSALSSSYSNFMVAGSNLFFIAQANGMSQLCVSDGTTAGSQALSVIAPEVDMMNATPLVANGNTLFFVAYHSLYGYELYKTDGTNSGTQFLKDINTQTFISSNQFTQKDALNNKVFFSFDNNKNGFQLWQTDGSTSNTILLSSTISYPTNFISPFGNYYSNSGTTSKILKFKNEIYAYHSGSLWKSDGINPFNIFFGSKTRISNGGSTNPMVVSNGKLFFGNPEDSELWATDGTEEGTYLVKQVTNSSLYPYQMIDFNNTLVFVGYEPSTGYELYKSDGTTAGTTIVKETIAGTSNHTIYSLTKVGNKLFYYTFNSNISQYQLWVSDGTESGTFVLKSSTNLFSMLTNLNDNTLLFTITEIGFGNELWRSDGTISGTVLVKDIHPGTSSSNPFNYFNGNQQFSVYNGKAYFSARDNSSSNSKLYVSDGTAAGTFAVSNSINPQSIYSTPYGLFFNGYSNQNIFGNELYKSDGTSAGTSLVADINPQNLNSNPFNFFYHDNLLYFMATNSTTGTEIYVMKLCDENLNITTNVNGTQTYQVNQYITANNTIQPDARINYVAGKAIQLNPGFKTDNSEMFLAKITGCVQNPANPMSSPSKSQNFDKKSIEKTKAYLNDLARTPSIEDILQRASNSARELWYHFRNEKEKLEYELSILDETKTENLNQIEYYKEQLQAFQSNILLVRDNSKNIIAYELSIKTPNNQINEEFNIELFNH